MFEHNKHNTFSLEQNTSNNTVLQVKPRLINACGSLNCSFIMTYVMLTTFIIIISIYIYHETKNNKAKDFHHTV